MASLSPEVTQSWQSEASNIDITVTKATSEVHEVEDEVIEDRTDGDNTQPTSDRRFITSSEEHKEGIEQVSETNDVKKDSSSAAESSVSGHHNEGGLSSEMNKKINVRRSSSSSSSYLPPVHGSGMVSSPTFPFISRSFSNTSATGMSSYRFSWSAIHQQLLGNLLSCILPHLDSWKQYAVFFD